MVGLLSTAVTGLQVSQTALNTTGHNIANANTEGYSRQKVEVATNRPNLTGAGFIGNGATVTAIERVVDEFLVAQLRTDTSLNNELSAFSENIRQLDTLLSDPSTGLSQGLSKFFAVVENGADDPTSIPSRQLIISEAENLTRRFNTLFERITTVGENIDSKMDVAVNQINALAENIAKINQNIAQTVGGSDRSPNDLLDQREEALRQLAELVAIDVVDQGDGLLNVSIGSGQGLVVGSNARAISIVDGTLDPQLRDIAYVDGKGAQVITPFVTGGELGGLIDFRDGVLSEAFNELGRVAMVLSESFNEVHQKGVDLNNQFGGDFFRDVNDPVLSTKRVFGDRGNAAPNDRVMTVELVDSTELTSSDYVLEVAHGDTSYRVTRKSDGAVVYADSLPGRTPASIEFDGIKLTFAQGSFQIGDRFLIQPTRTAARDIEAAIRRPDQLAFSSPLATKTDIGNLGNATITAGSLTGLALADGSAVDLFSSQGAMNRPLLIQFTSATTYDILDNSDPGNPVQLDPPQRNRIYVPGRENPLFSQDVGETIVVANSSALGISAVNSGAAPQPAVANGYPSEIFTFSYLNPTTGAVTQQSMTTSANASAKTLASQFSNISGVSAQARNSMVLSDLDSVSNTSPLQLNLNGVDLIEYTGAVISADIPDPLASTAQFNDYLAERINQNTTLEAMGVYAVAGTNSATGQAELRIFSTQGDDFNLTLEAGAGESLTVSDYNSVAATLNGSGVGNEATVTVGGTLDLTLATGYSMQTNPALSSLFGNSTAAGFAKSSYLGIEASINGVPEAGDRFTLGFNQNGISDNRNALALVSLSTEEIIEKGERSLGSAYGTLVEVIGIKTNASEINMKASEQVLTQTQDLRNAVSGVNLDEEAANLIQFEQIYNANAQVISVARDLFERLINIF